MNRKTTAFVIATVAGSLALPAPAFAQPVADRALSDVRVDSVGACTTLTINFNIRLQILSSFPESGRELHVRVRPLDSSGISAIKESLRTPTSVPDLRSIEYEGDSSSGPVLSLFFTKDTHFKVSPGLLPQQMVIGLSRPGAGAVCSQAVSVVPAAPPAAAPPAAAPPPVAVPGTVAVARPAPAAAIASGLYVVNIVSQPTAIGALTEPQKQLLTGRLVYESEFERDAQKWHRLRVGFFETREAADAERARLAKQFKDAWVVKITAEERADGSTRRFEQVPTATVFAAIPTPAFGATDTDRTDTATIIADAEQAIRDGNNDRAIQLLTNALAKPENENTPRALELLGLTRERKGQLAHAQAEYEEFLKRYPTGEASDRVRQRLAAISVAAAGAGTSPELRQARGQGSAAEWKWGLRGSFSQFYFRDQSKLRIPDAINNGANNEVDNSVNLNQLLTSADLTISGGNDRRQIQLRAAGSYNQNFGTSSTSITKGNTTFNSRPGEGIKALTALYLDFSDSDTGLQTRLGRQTRNSAGVLGRFDGGLLSWRTSPKLRFNIVGGFPVLTSRQTFVLKDRYFYGASVDIGAKQSPIQTSFYVFDQHARGGFIDRRSVGLETRVLKKRFNAFSILDYDVKYQKLNLGLLSLNYNFPDNSSLSVTADYRRSPLLTTNNALTGMQVATLDPITHVPTFTIDANNQVVQTFVAPTDLVGLRPFFTDQEIYNLALARTLVAKSFTASYSRPISSKLQANIDFTLTDTGGTPETLARSYTDINGVPNNPNLLLYNTVGALPASGKEYYYGAQLIGSGLFWNSDIYILSGRYADTQNSRSYSADFNARVPVTTKFRLSPRVRYGYRSDKMTDGNFSQLQPTMKFNYFPLKHSEIEVEVGANFTHQRTVMAGTPTISDETGFVINAGYRIDF